MGNERGGWVGGLGRGKGWWKEGEGGGERETDRQKERETELYYTRITILGNINQSIFYFMSVHIEVILV